MSEHFPLAELTFSQTALRLGIANYPNAEQIANLVRLCADVLEPTRLLLRCPMKVTSGYRSPEINSRVGGSKTSAHMEGRAADVIPTQGKLHDAFAAVMCSDIPYDQLILEAGSWLHLAVARSGEQPRRECLLATGYPGHWEYMRV